MHLRHVAHQQLRRIARRYPILRRISLVTTALTLLWLYVIHWGERSLFASHIDTCHWDEWEKWPAEASPHHLVLISDPQLVDPHTYPGRPWPLSTLTEQYTDRYMARNFRLINADLDPDSIVFLGDLFDGGREWATSKARPLKTHQRKMLERLGVLKVDKKPAENDEVAGRKDKRSLDSYKKAILAPHDHRVRKEDHFITEDNKDLKEFVPGEGGRWSAWDQKQWDTDYSRFTRIFFEADQLYPDVGQERMTFPAFEVAKDQVSVQNGANNVTHREYATSGGKQRRVIASLPGNHDVGFGSGVQLAVRDRFHMHFGESNRVDVIGNHTFISVDTPSLSASGQFVPEGGETQPDRIIELTHLWQPTMHFIEDLRTPAGKAVTDTLDQYFPSPADNRKSGYAHSVSEPSDLSDQPSTTELASEALRTKPQLPVILLTHVPLYRDPDTECGPLRERGHALTIQAGYQYQNVVTRSLSNTVISRVSAAGFLTHVFSGDDHDYCDITHRYNIGPQPGTAGNDGQKKGPRLQNVKEETVKSFSWAMGVRKPGFLLVSLWNPVDEKGESIGMDGPTVKTKLCLLPDQLNVFIDYAMLLGCTLVVLLVRAVIIGLRSNGSMNEADGAESPATKLTLPRYQPKANGTVNGYSTPTKASTTKSGRQRTASTSTSSHLNGSANTTLGVQRSYNARTRSVSPAAGYAPPNAQQGSGTLIEKAGYFPQVRWSDPTDEDSDEESRLGSFDGREAEDEVEDSQAKWKHRRRRGPNKAWVAVTEFFASMGLVGGPAVVWYIWLIRHG